MFSTHEHYAFWFPDTDAHIRIPDVNGTCVIIKHYDNAYARTAVDCLSETYYYYYNLPVIIIIIPTIPIIVVVCSVCVHRHRSRVPGVCCARLQYLWHAFAWRHCVYLVEGGGVSDVFWRFHEIFRFFFFFSIYKYYKIESTCVIYVVRFKLVYYVWFYLNLQIKTDACGQLLYNRAHYIPPRYR